MLLPQAIDRVQNDVTLQAFDGSRFFMTRFALVSVLDLFDQELRVLFGVPAFKFRFILGQTQWKRRVYPMDEAGVIRFIANEIFFYSYWHGFIDHVVNVRARFLGIDDFVAPGVNDLALH